MIETMIILFRIAFSTNVLPKKRKKKENIMAAQNLLKGKKETALNVV